MGSQKVNRKFIVAHQPEARPIIDFYRLTKNVAHRAFTVYENDNAKLVISGEGKINCAAATAYCHTLESDAYNPSMWVNVGVAGHATHPQGSLWRVNRVVDSVTSNAVFPTNILRSANINGELLITVDMPETVYLKDSLYDMEASAFFQTASRFTSLEYINSFKVVSDNKNQPLDQFTLSLATKMIGEQIQAIDRYLNELENNLKNSFNKLQQIIDIKSKLFLKYKFTHAQKLQCDELLKALTVHGIQYGEELLQYSKGKQVLDLLSSKLKKLQLAV